MSDFFSSSLFPLAVYAAALVVAVVIAVRRRPVAAVSDFVLAGSAAGPLRIGFSLFVTTLSAEWVLGTAGVSMSVAMITAGGMVLAVGMLAPRLIASRPLTLPQFVTWRFDQRTGLILSGATVAFTLGVRLPLVLLTGSWTLHRLTGWGVEWIAVGLLASAGIVVLAGGCAAMLAGHTVQATVAVVGALTVAIFFGLVPGTPPLSSPEPSIPGADIPLPVAVAAALIIAIWYWCADNFVVQRFLAARDAKAVVRGTLLTAVLIIASAPFVFPLPLQEFESLALPPGIAGILAATVSAVIMAALTGYVQSTVSLIMVDFYVARHSAATDARLLRVGRIATASVVLLAVLSVPQLLATTPSAAVVVQRLQMYLAAPAAALMIGTLFIHRRVIRSVGPALIACGVLETVHAVGWLGRGDGLLGRLGAVDPVYVALLAFAVTLTGIVYGGPNAKFATPVSITRIPRPGSRRHERTHSRYGL